MPEIRLALFLRARNLSTPALITQVSQIKVDYLIISITRSLLLDFSREYCEGGSWR
jgi:hypothetical protein